ncbi:LamG-like jellyroll fold domain-containing protein [Psychrobacter sp. JB193]|uniref:LamG-like jellyroll fold domain-containing protein n=1 Tax=Psychrobacter sp. JB193 TaxID=2024406 RepID=UPI000BAAB6D9|nr:LamG-like jellyroll fold domain-containing protein [Psychrobacter sp. JB193]PAT63914.1 hypothetical protein CIK80_02040 [Psychrobacter sp. JB193]
MGSVIRLKNLNIGSSPLGAISVPFLPDSTMTLVPSVNGVVSKLPAGVTLTPVGSPTVTADYIQGNANVNYLTTNYVRDSTKSFTLALVMKRDAVNGTQFYAGDYHNASHPKYPNNAGMGIISTSTQGIRPTIHLTSGSIFSTSNMPAALNTGVNLGEWYFACLTVNATTKTATLYVPALNVAWTDTYTSEMRPLEYDETFNFVGNVSGASGGAAYLAQLSFYERHFTQAEVMQQYELSKRYCQAKGLTVN